MNESIPNPCPHCGGAAICDPWPVGLGEHQRTYYKVLCRQVISCCASGGAFPTESEAIAAWNRRPVSALQQQPEPVAATALTEGFDGSAVVPGLNHSTVYLWYDSEERARAARAFILDVLAATPSTPQGETK